MTPILYLDVERQIVAFGRSSSLSLTLHIFSINPYNMLRTAPRQVLRQSALPVRAQRMGVRYQSTAPIKRRSFKNTLVRWGIAIGGVYWYNTSPIFNEAPACKLVPSRGKRF